MAGTRRYNTYRGRRPKWKTALAILLILIILAAAAFIWAQRFLVYDASGNPRWDFFHSSPIDADVSTSVDPDASGDTSGGAGTSAPPDTSGTPDASGTPDTPGTPEALVQAVLLPVDAAGWDTVLASNPSAVCVTMKASGGWLQYQSAVEGARISDTAAAVSNALPALLQGERHTIARISCLWDSTYSQYHVRDAGLRNTGHYIFYDGRGENWLDPSKELTVQYLRGIVLECAAMGFDEILLTDVSYPTEGKLNKIDYNGADRPTALQSLVSSLSDALAAQYPDVTVSIELPAPVITVGQDSNAGLSLAGMAACVDRIYARTTLANSASLADAVAAVQSEFVPELTGETSADGSYLRLG